MCLNRDWITLPTVVQESGLDGSDVPSTSWLPWVWKNNQREVTGENGKTFWFNREQGESVECTGPSSVASCSSFMQQRPPCRWHLCLCSKTCLSADFAPKKGTAGTQFPALSTERNLGLGVWRPEFECPSASCVTVWSQNHYYLFLSLSLFCLNKDEDT